MTLSYQESQCLYVCSLKKSNTRSVFIWFHSKDSAQCQTLYISFWKVLWIFGWPPRLGEIVQKCLFTFSTLKRSTPKLCGSDRGICDPERNSQTCFDISTWLTPFDLRIKRHPISQTFIRQRWICLLSKSNIGQDIVSKFLQLSLSLCLQALHLECNAG